MDEKTEKFIVDELTALDGRWADLDAKVDNLADRVTVLREDVNDTRRDIAAGFADLKSGLQETQAGLIIAVQKLLAPIREDMLGLHRRMNRVEEAQEG